MHCSDLNYGRHRFQSNLSLTLCSVLHSVLNGHCVIWCNRQNSIKLLLCARVGRKARQPCKIDWKWREKERGRESTLPSLPFHSIEYAPGQTDIWVTLHSLKRVRQIPDPSFPPPSLSAAPSLTNCTFECQTSSLSNKSIVCQFVGHWHEAASKLWNLSAVNECECVCMCARVCLMLASCPISSQPF